MDDVPLELELARVRHIRNIERIANAEGAGSDDYALSVAGQLIDRFWGFLQCVSWSRVQIATFPGMRAFKEQRVIDRSAGTILLDATADIDGISSIVPWRVETETPKARYDNLEIVHVPQHTKKRLREYLKTASNQRA